MAHNLTMFENPNTGAIKEAPEGFSWTTLFFNFFPALFRGDLKWALIMIIISFITFGLSSLVFCFIYNDIYITDLIGSGFKAKSVTSKTVSKTLQKHTQDDLLNNYSG